MRSDGVIEKPSLLTLYVMSNVIYVIFMVVNEGQQIIGFVLFAAYKIKKNNNFPSVTPAALLASVVE